MEPRRIQVEDRAYQLESWPVNDGDVWAFKLLRLLSIAASSSKAGEQEPASSLPKDEDLSIGTLLERVTPEEFTSFRDACYRHTSIVEADADGAELVRPMNREAMRGRYSDAFAIIAGHLRHEFAPFLFSVARTMGAGGKTKGPTSGASTSPSSSTG